LHCTPELFRVIGAIDELVAIHLHAVLHWICA
jgi:hypothetical protein